MSWRFVTVEKDGSEGYSTAMTEGRALTWIRDLLQIGVRVIRMESHSGEFLDEEAVKDVVRTGKVSSGG
jgi:hypothetical protein